MMLEYLDLEDTKPLPLLLIFCESLKSDVLKIAFKIDESNMERCYKSLEGAFIAVADSIEMVSDSNVKNTTEIYNLMADGEGTRTLNLRIDSLRSWVL